MWNASLGGKALPIALGEVTGLRHKDWTRLQVDARGLTYVTNIVVWVHWCLGAMSAFEILYRPTYGTVTFAAYLVMLVSLMALNGYIHYLLLSKRSVTRRWILAICVMDVGTVSGALVVSGGFDHYFLHLLYFPALALFAVVFASFGLNMVWVTVVVATYLGISFAVGGGLDFADRQEKPLIARVGTMYAVVATVNLVSSFERVRLQEAIKRERALQHERTELSRTIHDTTAQSTYMVGLGLDRLKALVGQGSPELTAVIDETAQLSRSAMWELRQPINMGSIYEGREIGRTLRSHAASFSAITSVPAEVTQTGPEPHLSIESKSRLFTIAHNALTNAYRHAQATRVRVDLEFGGETIRISVLDDGRGLPEDYEQRGHGFASMKEAAATLGGHLAVQRQGALGGTTVTCVVPGGRHL